MTVIEQLADFIKNAENGLRNLWLEDDVMKVYVRKGHHIISQNRNIATTLDIAAVEVVQEKRNQGHWSNFLAKAHEMNPWDATFVECVHNQDLAISLLKHGWMQSPGVAMESFFLPKDIDKYYDQMFAKQKFNPGIML